MIRKNDTVMVMVGKDKGKTGKILALFSDRGKALVEKINRVKRHQKPTQKMRQGGILEKEAPISISNLLLYCTKCQRGVRTGIRIGKDGTKVRFCRQCEEAFAA